MLTGRGSAPPLPEETVLDVDPPLVERLGTAEAFDLHHRVGTIDDQFIAVAVAVEDGTHFTADDVLGATEEADHATLIGEGSPKQ